MMPYLQNTYANPSSIHQAGRTARRGVEKARDQVAAAIGAQPKEIVFTSGATEADNHVLRSLAAQHPDKQIITSSAEHAAVLTPAKHLADDGHSIIFLEPSASGEISPEQVQAALTPDTSLVALMLINNETGVVTDIPRISQMVHEAGALLFCDAVQAFGFMDVGVNALGVDFLSPVWA